MSENHKGAIVNHSARSSDAAEFGWSILTRIREYPDLRGLTALHPMTGIPGQYWDPLDLDHGDLGVALVFAGADELRPDDGWDRAALPYISRAVDALPSHIRALGPDAMGLFGGAACVAYTLRSLSRFGERYQNAIAQVDSLMLDLVEAHLGSVPDEGPSTDDYDIISGLAGPTRMLLQIPNIRGRSAAVLTASVSQLSRWAVMTDGYRTPPERITSLEREHQPDLHAGYINLGYAHGICGVLATLAEAANRQIGGALTREAAQHVAETVVDSILEGANGPRLPFMSPTSPVSPQEGVGGTSRVGWCYGNVSAALALTSYLPISSQQLDTAALIDCLWDSATQTPPSSIDKNPSLCHGVAGLLLIQRHLSSYGGLTSSDSAASAEVLAGRLLGMRDPQLLFGLRNQQRTLLDSPGFLTGSGGAAVALISWAESSRLTMAEKLISGGPLC
ncbi:lanthionine synthetase LanC family protein [Pseudonocardia sp. ICBG1142]|uniref:lanthionine synthetase LanC family protein n=1 Tax=Pseudonocardia sp. ICBG1142 TaxID=2846760 RepID=UPI0035A95573